MKRVVIARFLVDLQQNSVPLRVGNFNDETVTLHKGTVASVCEKVNNIEIRVKDLQIFCQINRKQLV